MLEKNNDLTLANKDQIAHQFTPATTVLDDDIIALQTQLNTKEAEVNALYNTYITEAEGTARTQRLGNGIVYKKNLINMMLPWPNSKN